MAAVEEGYHIHWQQPSSVIVGRFQHFLRKNQLNFLLSSIMSGIKSMAIIATILTAMIRMTSMCFNMMARKAL